MAEEGQGKPACLSPPAVIPFGSKQMIEKSAFDSAAAMPLRRAAVAAVRPRSPEGEAELASIRARKLPRLLPI